MRPATTFGDPERLTIDYLAAQFAARVEAYTPDTITSAFPTAALTGDGTHLQVELEASEGDDYPATERAQVRVTAYAAPGKRTNAKSLASLAHALLLAHPCSASIVGTSPILGRSSVIEDPTTKNLMVWFLARVNLVPVPLP